MSFAENLKKIRHEKRLSQRELGQLLNITGSMIGQYEAGLRNPRLETVQRIATALDVRASDLTDSPDLPPVPLNGNTDISSIPGSMQIDSSTQEVFAYVAFMNCLGFHVNADPRAKPGNAFEGACVLHNGHTGKFYSMTSADAAKLEQDVLEHTKWLVKELIESHPEIIISIKYDSNGNK